jgi:hypothetical protein
VRNGAAHFKVAVRVQSIEQAASVVRGNYPGCEVRVKFPLDPEGFLVKEPSHRLGIVGLGRPEFIAA